MELLIVVFSVNYELFKEWEKVLIKSLNDQFKKNTKLGIGLLNKIKIEPIDLNLLLKETIKKATQRYNSNLILYEEDLRAYIFYQLFEILEENGYHMFCEYSPFKGERHDLAIFSIDNMKIPEFIIEFKIDKQDYEGNKGAGAGRERFLEDLDKLKRRYILNKKENITHFYEVVFLHSDSSTERYIEYMEICKNFFQKNSSEIAIKQFHCYMYFKSTKELSILPDQN